MSKNTLDANLIAIRELARQLTGENQKGVFDAIKGLLEKVSDEISDLKHRLAATNCDLANYQNANDALLSQIEELMEAACCDEAKIAGLEEDLKKKNEEIFSLEILLANQEFATQGSAETKAAKPKPNPKDWGKFAKKLREANDTGEGPCNEVKKTGRQTPRVGDVLSQDGKLSQSNVDGKMAKKFLEKFGDDIQTVDKKPGREFVKLSKIPEELLEFASKNSNICCNFNYNLKCSCPYGKKCQFLHAVIYNGKLYIGNVTGLWNFKKRREQEESNWY